MDTGSAPPATPRATSGDGRWRRAWRIARQVHPVGWVLIAGVPIVLLALLVNTVVQDVLKTQAAKPTALHVTHCWRAMDRRVETRYCAIIWSLPDGSRGSGSIEPNDPTIDAGSTIHGWATPTEAWTSSPRWEPLTKDWPLGLVLAVAIVTVIGVSRRVAERRRRNGPAPTPRTRPQADQPPN